MVWAYAEDTNIFYYVPIKYRFETVDAVLQPVSTSSLGEEEALERYYAAKGAVLTDSGRPHVNSEHEILSSLIASWELELL